MANWNEDDHPRVPAGKGDVSGQWTSAEKAARLSAGLDYTIHGGGVISKIRAGETIPQSLCNKLISSMSRVAVIYNSATRTWHIANNEGIYHAEFTKAALEEVDTDTPDALIARGYFSIDAGDLDMWDLVEPGDREGIILTGDPFEVRRIIYQFKSTIKSVESGLFQYRSEDGKIRTPVVFWSSLSESSRGNPVQGLFSEDEDERRFYIDD